MAIIQTIRDKYAKLAGFIIILALLGFVLMDFGKSSFSGATTAAEIQGEDLDVNEFFQKVNTQRNIAALSDQEITEEMGEQITDQVFENEVSNIVLEDLYTNLGIGVSEDELNDMFAGAQPDMLAQRIYMKMNPQAQSYDPNVANEILTSLKDPSNPEQFRFWLGIKETLENTKKQAKINNLIAASFYTPQVILDAQSEMGAKVAQIDFIQIPYTFVSDDKVAVTDEEVNNYINNNKYIFTNKVNSRDLDIVTIPIIPSAADSAEFFKETDSLKSLFAAAEKPEDFASLNSSKQVPNNYFSESQLAPLQNSKDLLDAPVNSIVGPFPFEGSYALAKIIDRVNVADTVEVKEIVVVSQMGSNNMRTKEQAKARIDSAMAEINAGVSIDSVGIKYADNAAQNPNGVNTTHYSEQYGMMPKAMSEFVFNGAPNTSKLIEIDEEGMVIYYYVQIVKKSASTKKVQKIQFVTRDFTPSAQTRTNIEILANSFASAVAQGSKSFEQQALEMGLQKRPVNGYNPNSKLIPGIGTSVDLAKWTNAATVGSVSPVTIVNNNYVVAKLTNINVLNELNRSEAALNYAKEEVKKKKKADILKAEYDSKGDINAIASALSQPLTSIDTFTLNNPNNALLASEAKVTGYVFSGAQSNTTSKGITGNSGVFYVKVKSLNANPVAARNVQVERKSMTGIYRQNAYRMLLNNKMEKAEIKDMRNKFLN